MLNMKDIKFVQLTDIEESQLIALMNNQLVGQHMPLLSQGFDLEQCQTFIKAKQKLWAEHGYGPWAFIIQGEFAGWGGLQPEQGEADFALVLHPKFWGWGRKIFNKVKHHAFEKMNLPSITVLFPPNRRNSLAILRLGFVKEDSIMVDGETFDKFRLYNPQKN